MIYGFKRLAEHGLGGGAIAAILGGIALGAVFLRRQTLLADPMIDVRLFKAPAFSAAFATNTVAIFGAFGAFLFTAQYLQLVEGLSPPRAGVWSLPSSLGFIVGEMLSPLVVKHVHPANIVGAGLAFAALGFLVLTQIGGGNGLALLVLGSVIFSLGLSSVFTLTTDLIVGSAPPERAGAASAISETGAEFGGALGIAILGGIATAVYRRDVANSLPAGIAPETADAARDTLGGAVAAAAAHGRAGGVRERHASDVRDRSGRADRRRGSCGSAAQTCATQRWGVRRVPFRIGTNRQDRTGGIGACGVTNIVLILGVMDRLGPGFESGALDPPRSSLIAFRCRPGLFHEESPDGFARWMFRGNR